MSVSISIFYNDYTFRIVVTNNTTGIGENSLTIKPEYVKSIDVLGRKVDPNNGGFRIDVYSDGTTKKIYQQK